MAPVGPPANILVTGGSGFIGSWVIRGLLERGYLVRAAVRTPSKGEYLRGLFAEFHSQFESITVSDFEADGAFDDALKSIDAVQHIASPLGGNPDEAVSGAVNGTMSVLKSVARNGKAIQRIIITSSVAAVKEPKQYPCVYTEDDWNLSASKALENKNATAEQKYYASKTLAEQKAWDFAREMNIDLVTMLSTIVIGPVIHEVLSMDKLNYSSGLFYDGILHERPRDANFGGWVDVRDVADAHILAMEKENASGQRFITSAGMASWQHIYNALNETTPKLENIPVGEPGKTEGTSPWSFDTRKIENLGIKFRTLGRSARDTVDSMRARGW